MNFNIMAERSIQPISYGGHAVAPTPSIFGVEANADLSYD
jgi:hypothetical protein